MAMMPIIPKFSFIVEAYGDKILWSAIIMLGVVIICNKPSVWDLIACVWSIVTVYISGNAVMLILMFSVMAARKSNVEKVSIVKAWMLPASILIIIILILYPIMHAQENPIAADYCGTRWNYFFAHPNGFGLWFGFWVFGAWYLTEKKISRWITSLMLLMAAVFLAKVPESKTTAIVLIMGAVLFIMEKYAWKICRVIVCIMPVFAILLTIGLTYIYYSGILLCNQYVLHPTLSMRFQDAAINLTKSPLNLWGQKIYHLGESVEFYGIVRNDVSMDNAIVGMCIYYGIVLGILVIATMVLTIFKQVREEGEKYRIQAILLSLTFVMGMMEWPAWYATIGFPMFFMGDWLRENDKKKSKIT